MKRLTGRTLLAAISLVTALVAHSAIADEPSKTPNIVLIFCDDLGYGDLGCYGARGYATPNLDRLAAEGVRFTRFYSGQPVCSASRSALMTGCYPSRVSIQGALGPQAKIGINDNELTLAELVKQRGYATAIFGKWHLGHERQFLPTHHGFDEYFGLPYSNDMWPLHPEYAKLPPAVAKRKRGFPDLPLIEGEQVKIAAVTADDQRNLTTWYTEHAVSFINRNHDRPFFLYVPHSMPHVPLYVSDKFAGKTSKGVFGDVIEEIDWSVGQILATLDKHDLAKNTLVMFTSDNGPWLSYGEHAGSAGPLREGKGTCWDGGVREPFVARWPGKIPPGSICHEAAMTIDILPTIAGLIGAEAVVVLDADRSDGLVFLRKMTMQLASKMRFASAQLLALFDDELGLRSAAHANAMAQRLRAALQAGIDNGTLTGLAFTQPPQANAIFATLPNEIADRIRARVRFYDWDRTRGEVRWMTAWDTTPEDVDRFVAVVAEEFAQAQ